MEPVQIYSQNGVARFQVNRRNNDELTLILQTELKGPNDYAVPVLKVLNPARAFPEVLLRGKRAQYNKHWIEDSSQLAARIFN